MQLDGAMAEGISVGCELQKPKITWRVIEGFAGSRRREFTRQRTVHIVRHFLKANLEGVVSAGELAPPSDVTIQSQTESSQSLNNYTT